MRKICVYTSTRAEYGLLRNLIREIQDSPEFLLQLLVSGTHLVSEHGMTVNEIYGDGFAVDQSIDIELTDDSPAGICHSMGVAVSSYGKFLMEYKPDLLVILGDRFEAFCCASAALVCRIPIAHIHGGETTEGSYDEAFRHSITKMAHLHFPGCEESKNRIIQLGEFPQNVYNFGALGVENIKKMKMMDKNELEKSINFRLDKPFFLITFHPVTLEKNTSGLQFAELLSALEKFTDHKFIFTQANADTDGQIINEMLLEFNKLHPNRSFLTPSLGYHRYLSAMQLCDAVIGNSSSGIIEAPVLKVPTINVGDRQKGRSRTHSIVDCEPTKESIVSALKIICSNEYQLNLERMTMPYEKDGTTKNIVKILKTVNLKSVLKKRFFNIQND